jgi:hypothetical protein
MSNHPGGERNRALGVRRHYAFCRFDLALAAGLLCGVCPAFADAPYRVLNHEAIRIDAQKLDSGHQHLSLAAFGKQFELSLRPNENIRRAVPSGRSDIQPLEGTLDGLPGSWVRITSTRAGWRGMLFDGQELYAIEPVGDVAEALVQPHPVSSTAPVMYRLADALMAVGTGFCETLDADGAPVTAGTPDSSTPERRSALKIYQAIAADLGGVAAQYPTRRLMTGIVADREFANAFADPQGAIIARMDIVDGIFSTQVGVRIALGSVTVITGNGPFTSTTPSDLLGQLRQYRNSSPAQMSLGVTHLMTGRNLDSDIVGISYQGSVCNGATSAGLSEGWHSTTMSALIAAHELGHNFNAPHDGVAGPCANTPQTYLMSPTINGSNQFSSCSLQQMQARIQNAPCLTQYIPPDVGVNLPDTAVGVGVNTPFTVSYSVNALGDDPSDNVSATVALPSNVTVQSATAGGAACSQGAGTVSCSLGTLAPGESRQIELQLMATSVGTTTITLGVNSSNDFDPGNNSGSITANVSAVASAASPPAEAAKSGAGTGGGGRIDLGWLTFLGLVLAGRLAVYARTTSRSLASTC